jgi:hypothetical protein
MDNEFLIQLYLLFVALVVVQIVVSLIKIKHRIRSHSPVFGWVCNNTDNHISFFWYVSNFFRMLKTTLTFLTHFTFFDVSDPIFPGRLRLVWKSRWQKIRIYQCFKIQFQSAQLKSALSFYIFVLVLCQFSPIPILLLQHSRKCEGVQKLVLEKLSYILVLIYWSMAAMGNPKRSEGQILAKQPCQGPK